MLVPCALVSPTAARASNGVETARLLTSGFQRANRFRYSCISLCVQINDLADRCREECDVVAGPRCIRRTSSWRLRSQWSIFSRRQTSSQRLMSVIQYAEPKLHVDRGRFRLAGHCLAAGSRPEFESQRLCSTTLRATSWFGPLRAIGIGEIPGHHSQQAPAITKLVESLQKISDASVVRVPSRQSGIC